MAKDPGFIFYPGDYLRDTQCLTEPVQVAYDRIMCEHMRNICISQSQLNFFTKRLNDDQKSELLMVLDSSEQGFFIPWVHESIIKRRAYSESRSKNRSKSYDNHMKTHEHHMENEIEIENKDLINKDKGVKGKQEKKRCGYVVSNPPTVEIIVQYCKEKGYKIDPQVFFDSNTAVGWKDKNGNLYVDWKAVVRKWAQMPWNQTQSQPRPSSAQKRPILIVVLEKIAQGLDNRQIKNDLVGQYVERDIDTAIMDARGKRV